MFEIVLSVKLDTPSTSCPDSHMILAPTETSSSLSYFMNRPKRKVRAVPLHVGVASIDESVISCHILASPDGEKSNAGKPQGCDMTASLVWKCTSCASTRRFARLSSHLRVVPGKRLLAHCKSCGEMRILAFLGVSSFPNQSSSRHTAIEKRGIRCNVGPALARPTASLTHGGDNVTSASRAVAMRFEGNSQQA